jgi:hypothetical protein
MEARQTAQCPGGWMIIMFRQPSILVTFQMANVMGVFDSKIVVIVLFLTAS